MGRKNNNNRSQHFQNLKGGDFIAASSRSFPSDAIEVQPIEVQVRDGNFERAFRTFRNIVQKERIISLYKEKQTYEKPSDKRRRKRNEMRRKTFEMENRNFSEERRPRKIEE